MPIYIGTAGWNLPKAAAPEFPTDGSHLARYATRFNAVEINTSFYRPHLRKTYERWAESVSPGFRFSVKLPRSITHELRLQHAESLLDKFLSEATGLGSKFGMLLVQLPPSLRFDAPLAESFFALVRQRLSVPIACEPRHASWFDSEVDALLSRYSVTRVAASPAICPSAGEPGGYLQQAYFRWHGAPRIYYSAYGHSDLERLTSSVRKLAEAECVWCIFDNTAEGAAVENALQLKSLIDVSAEAGVPCP